jgi:hypothetical protein
MKTPKSLASALTMILTAAAVAIPQAPASADRADCPSGHMCLWSGRQYRGTMKAISATESYRTIGLQTVESYYNNRTKRTWLHSTTDGSGIYACLSPGARSGDLTGWQETAKAVYLASISSC